MYSVPQCVFLSYVLLVESNIVLFKPFIDVFVKVPSLQIQLYSCCFGHVQYLFPQWVFVLRYALLFFFFRDCFLQDVCVLGFYGQLGVQVVFVYMFFGCSRHIVLCIC